MRGMRGDDEREGEKRGGERLSRSGRVNEEQREAKGGTMQIFHVVTCIPPRPQLFLSLQLSARITAQRTAAYAGLRAQDAGGAGLTVISQVAVVVMLQPLFFPPPPHAILLLLACIASDCEVALRTGTAHCWSQTQEAYD